PEQVEWTHKIRVPFAPETPASGIGRTDFYAGVWYQREFQVPQPPRNGRLLLHFEAVDFAATVWVNGRRMIRHDGGYTPFVGDITEVVTPGQPATIVVRAED